MGSGVKHILAKQWTPILVKGNHGTSSKRQRVSNWNVRRIVDILVNGHDHISHQQKLYTGQETKGNGVELAKWSSPKDF